MRFCRFDGDKVGIVEGDSVRDVSAALAHLPQFRYPLPRHDVLVANLDTIRAEIAALDESAPLLPLDAVDLLSPVANPGKIIGAPLNYEKHLAEARANPEIHQGNPANLATIDRAGLFLKATSSLAGPSEGIVICKPDRRTDPEVELVAVVGAPARNVSKDRAMDYVAGYTIGLDVTTRGTEDRSLRKSADTYSIVGPWLVTADEIPDAGALELSLSVNGEERQRSNTKDLILGVPALIELASSFYTLHPGDLLFTGTPEGVNSIKPGDRVVASIQDIGTLHVAVRPAES